MAARAAAIVLAGGRSSRMGSPKAWLPWHGSTLLRRVTGIAARAVDGPVVVVGAPGQALPAPPAGVQLATDAREGAGPLEGIAAGLEAIGERAAVAYVSSTDVPLLHPAFISRVVGALEAGFDAALPEVGGHRQPLAAAYRPSLLKLVLELIDAGRMRPAFLFERCRTRMLSERELLADPALARADPELRSVWNLNERADYERALMLAPPTIEVRMYGTLAGPGSERRRTVGAWSLGELAAAVGVELGEHVVAALNGDQITRDAELPLVAGDKVSLMAADAGG
ncbi:MAG TPA: NTP transferase domain-containing protein [Solirubrobacteraceae bacterium]|nr:NTP transferase domain-containing protein [Solirubrobacteraceae bacterium]